jgi:hypothetical protein
VLSGRRTWIGYAHGIPIDKLPKLKEGILPPYNIKEGYTPSAPVKNKINFTYAQHYDPSADIALLLKNFKFMGASQTF